MEAHARLGNRWSDIAREISGRSENSVKNHWNATLKRRCGICSRRFRAYVMLLYILLVSSHHMSNVLFVGHLQDLVPVFPPSATPPALTRRLSSCI